MANIAVIQYATPPSDYFWKWSGDLDAAEWRDGQTITLWQELHPILHVLQEEGGLPPLGAILLLLAACRDDWEMKKSALHVWLTQIIGWKDWTEDSSALLDALFAALAPVHQLPKDLRASPQAKVHLIVALFEDSVNRLSRDASSTVMVELRHAGPRVVAGKVPEFDSKSRFLRDVKGLLVVLANHDKASLEARLRTGLENPILLSPVLPDVAETSSPEGKSLLEKLEPMGGELRGVAAIAKRTIAMMNFPARVGQPKELPVGGISDISNRGTIDRLLPGELAWDDLVLAARLVHNEALYFQREVPPSKEPVHQVILLDRGLRLWGTNRVFSLGLALGLSQHPASRETAESIECFAATKEAYERLLLDTPQDVTIALEMLNPMADSISPLHAWWLDRLESPGARTEEITFITTHEHIESAEYKKVLGLMAESLTHDGGSLRVIGIDRSGGLEVQQWSTAGNRTLFRGEMDLEALLSDQSGKDDVFAKKAVRKKVEDTRSKSPFLFPLRPQATAFLPDENGEGGGIGVSTYNRLMYWPRAGSGGREIVHRVPGRNQWMSRDENGDPIVIAAAEKAGEPVRVFRVVHEVLEEIEIARATHSFPSFATVSGGVVLIAYSDLVEAFSLQTGLRVAEKKGTTISSKALLTFDGERIEVLANPDKACLVSERWPFSDAAWPQFFVPHFIAWERGKLWLSDGKESYQFGSLSCRWEKWKAHDLNWIPFLKSEISEGVESECHVARINERLEVHYDQARGVLHFLCLATHPVETCSILLTMPTASAWLPACGLVSRDDRLDDKVLSSGSETRTSGLRQLDDFLNKVWSLITP